MKWTPLSPTEPGWYWLEACECLGVLHRRQVGFVYVSALSGDFRVHWEDFRTRLDDPRIRAWGDGPIPQPEEGI